MLFSEFYPDYFTATILEWKHLHKQDKYKDINMSSFEFLVKQHEWNFITHYSTWQFVGEEHQQRRESAKAHYLKFLLLQKAI
jgi:hypothetical protein